MLDLIQNGAFIAVIAHGLIGGSLVWDKVLLKKRGTKNVFSYVFWLGSLSIFGLALIPFGYKSPPLAIIGIAFTAGILHLVGVFFYYVALKRGEASETLAIVGGFSPVATALIALALLSSQMTGWQLFGFILMSAGGFMMFISERPPMKKLLIPVAVAAGTLGLVNVLEKIVYNHSNFVSGYVWFTIGTFVGSVSLLIPTSWRTQIFRESGDSEPRGRFWYFVNRIISGVGSLLIYYAVSRTHPAIVDAISGVRYVVIFFGALLLTKFRPQWLKEDFHKWQLASKCAATCLVVAGLVLVGLSGGKKGGAGSPTASGKPRLWPPSQVAINSAMPGRNLRGKRLVSAPKLLPRGFAASEPAVTGILHLDDMGGENDN
ncbi:MAG TPA: DMT family transporter [Terriglobia bacterium]|nr:DMT family transporter [Terriglobia bacterium]